MMMVAMVTTVFAADPTITISTPAGHTYEVFQVFTGEVDGQTLTSLKYGENAVGEEGKAVSQTDMETLKGLSAGTNVTGQAAQVLIDTLATFVDFTSTPVATVESATATAGLPAGYYVIRDKMSELPDNEGATLLMFQVLGADLTITAKSDKPSSEKKVDDVNDSTGTGTTLKDSADYEIGDSIPYTLTFTLPSDYANYEHYYVNFKDTLTAGLTYNGDAQIYFGESDTTGEAINFGTGLNLSYAITDLKTGTDEQKALTAGDKIIIKYTCYLNESAVIGGAGNPNTYNVEFSSNPNNTGNGTSKPTDTKETPLDTNIVFTYKTVFNKVDEDGNALPGADFTLYKLIKGEDGADDEWVDVTTLGENKHPSKTLDGTQSTADTKGTAKKFTFTGLDDGQYKLVETVVPTGYNQMADFIFTIEAEHDLDADTPTLKSLTIKNADGEVISGEELQFTAEKSNGTAEADIENKSGATLPSTGGIGTTIFYVIGAILVLGAGILLVSKRRMAE